MMDDDLSVEVAELFPRRGDWTEADYLTLPETTRIVELAGGNVIVHPPPDSDHERAVLNLGYELHQFVQTRELGTVLTAPLPIRLWEDHLRVPDVLFYSAARESEIGGEISGPPDWVAEVLSSGTKESDEGDKLSEYAEAGISEYWIVDPKKRTVRVYNLNDSAEYELHQRYTSSKVARSTVIDGFRVPVKSLL